MSNKSGPRQLGKSSQYALVISMISMSNPSESEWKKVPWQQLDIWPNQKIQKLPQKTAECFKITGNNWSVRIPATKNLGVLKPNVEG